MHQPERETSFWIRQLDALPRIKCHRCKKQNILPKPMRGLDFFKKGVCRYCKAPLTGPKSWFDRTRFFFPLIIFFACISYFVVLGVAARGNPVKGIQSVIRGYYKEAYGAQSEEMLQKHWGWFFKDESSARNNPSKSA